ncbi:MAG: ABC transporter permease [Chloroflexota bacterium]|nr:ABC transporter permease [Chloroflexota bacterium]
MSMLQQGETPTVSDALPLDEEGAVEQQTRANRRFRVPGWLGILWENRKSRVGLVMLAIFLIVAVFAPLFSPHDPRSNDFAPNLDPGSGHLLGTTTKGEDIFSQLVYGARTSLIVGVVGGLLATAIALVIGLTAGYLGGTVNEVLTFFINLALVVPILPLIALLSAYAPGQGLWVVILIIGLTGWASGARLKKAQILTLRSRDYITAAVFAGEGLWQVIFREIMPNMISLVVVGFMGSAMGAIGAEAGLAFLGFGNPETISWGTMSYWANNQGALVTGQWAWLLAPGLALSFLIMALTLVNFGVDALGNPQLREE